MFITDRVILERAADRAASSGGPHLPLLRAAADGRIDFAFILEPTAAWPRRIERSKRPAIAVIGADMGEDDDAPPDVWRCLRHARDWCRFLVLHAAGGEHGHYRRAVEAAERYRRVLIVECTPRTARAWMDAVGHPPGQSLLIWPRDGQHPIKPGVAH